MKQDIRRFSAEVVNQDDFIPTILNEEKPFIISSIEACDSKRLTPEEVKKLFCSKSKQDLGWYNSDLIENNNIQIPGIVKQIMKRTDMSFRKLPMRVFMQPCGHITLPHYDGNSLHVVNLQVTGRKKWILTSPHTPLPTLPFMFAGMVSRNFYYNPEKYDFMEFETLPGDLLFVPRYWYHEVHSLDKVNLNFTWVFTPFFPNEGSPLGKREVEIIKLRRIFPLINRIFPDNIREYGGCGEEIINRYTSNVNNLRVLTRFLKEVSKYPRLFLLAKELKARANEFAINNFNV
ncbi:cupin-like domain-containing protein [Nitrosomonas sp.]|uniref:cupin-like domain-containing protein n=1 Tax=Nitrosomonas sp. TaxID=42353 RepID=UPI00262A0603|nr:cupin-like domain-containing protein [Nitrosomonas sp.]MCC6835397.1 cupin-like domain-containing protein [Cytophagales bacterium]